MTALAMGSLSSANAINLNEFVKIKDGLYASIDVDGKLTEIATTEKTILEMDVDYDQSMSQNIRNFLTSKDSHNKANTTDLEVCGYSIWQNEALSTNGNTLSLTSTGQIAEFIGPFPPAPKFAFVRTKAKFKGFDANGNYVLKSLAVEREPVSNSNTAVSGNAKNFLSATYALASASAEIDTSQLARVAWTARTHYVVGNPIDNQNNFPATANGDCYQTMSVKISNNIYY